MPVRIFISHAHADADIASSILDLMIRAFNLPQAEIRCTSVSGFKLPGGSRIEDQLRNEVLNADLVISILTPTSLASTYVLFELGARWGTEKSIMPILSKGLTTRRVPEPLSQLHLIELYDVASVFQFLEDSATELDIQIAKPSSLHSQIEKVTEFSDIEASPQISIRQHPKAALLNLEKEDIERRKAILSCFYNNDVNYLGPICDKTKFNRSKTLFYLDEMIGEGLIEGKKDAGGNIIYEITHEGRRFWLKGPQKSNG